MIPDFKGVMEVLLTIGVLIGMAMVGLGWLLWHFGLSHISIGWH
jgi:hypothetical protein